MAQKIHIYERLWKSVLNTILEYIENGGGDFAIKRESFESCGGERNQSGYAFSLYYVDGELAPYGNASLRSSAVSRDLNNILSCSTMFRDLAKDIQIHFRCKQDNIYDSQYILSIKINK